MTPALRITMWSATGAVAMTGLVYGWMAYCLSPADPMDLVNHPWQPAMLHLHVLAAPIWLVVSGALWHAHVLPKLRSAVVTRRRSGIVLVALGVAMAASGYLLQTAIEDQARSLWQITHVATSLLWLVVLVCHVVSRPRVPAATERSPAAPGLGDIR